MAMEWIPVEFTDKQLLAMLAMMISLVGNGAYVVSIIQGKTKPHFFTFLIWTIIISLIFLAQLQDHAGLAAWATGINGAFCAIIALFAFKGRRAIEVVALDWWCLALSLSAIPLWYVTSSPFWSVILLTLIDILAFAPTVRKTMLKPFEENLFGHFTIALQQAVILVALEHYSVVTSFYAVSMVLAICGFILFTQYKRGLFSEWLAALEYISIAPSVAYEPVPIERQRDYWNQK